MSGTIPRLHTAFCNLVQGAPATWDVAFWPEKTIASISTGQRPGDLLPLQLSVASGVGTQASNIGHAPRQPVPIEARGSVDRRHGGGLQRTLREGIGTVAVRWHERGPGNGRIQQLVRRDRLLNDAHAGRCR